jgi:rhamnogalacturonyl hydrolase YesR
MTHSHQPPTNTATRALSAAEKWPAGATPQDVGRRVAETVPDRDFVLLVNTNMINYHEVCVWQGALCFAKLAGDKDLTERLVRRFDPLLGDNPRHANTAMNVDTAVFGSVPLEIYMQTGDRRYFDMGIALADGQWAVPADQSRLGDVAREAVRRGLSWHTRHWIDDMYMITMLQTQTYRATGDTKYRDRAAAEAVSYLDVLQLPNGLFYHTPGVPFFWGRGNGWFAAGMAELLRTLPENHPHRAPIMAGYKKMMTTLLVHQDAGGKWRQLVDDPASWPESSGTGMFTYAFITGIKNNWLDAATFAGPARKGWLALASWLTPDGRMRDVCRGTNALNDRQYYLDRPRLVGDLHGQAPVLWCASALLE